ncbi:hypothetical protein EDEG_01325 [Edhazardia aedis USNM 41457]|uniref:RRP4 S1 domain-containing protein n=1 Tax=Edhazardia aedis (strain USNM 41457) TaxID=1003232 RepID=J9DPH9_EDHAE|nr:hypothetical protein EDEG_01325 [Edhazardia aedis USNM 41457]|eukprot:EJW04455.1 hypothetical protein EDEG_01325 [Edhazardia aedis USNM 41457]
MVEKYIPGEIITTDATLIKGHNTHQITTTPDYIIPKSKFDTQLNAEIRKNKGLDETKPAESRSTDCLNKKNTDLQYNPGCIEGLNGFYNPDTSEQIIVSSIYGTPNLTQKLLTMHCIYNLKYIPHIGDTIIGRVTSLGDKRWFLSINCAKHGILLLDAVDTYDLNQNHLNKTNVIRNSVSLHHKGVHKDMQNIKNHKSLQNTIEHGPSKMIHVARRKLHEDAMEMRKIYDINDLVVCEVSKITGAISVHTRSIITGSSSQFYSGIGTNSYQGNSAMNVLSNTSGFISPNRKLLGGVVLLVPPSLIEKKKSQIVLLKNVRVILALNGIVWVHSDDPKDSVSIVKYVKKCRKEFKIIDEDVIKSLCN